MTQKIAVIGVGQSLRGDDAVGLEAVRQWQEQFPETACRPEVRVDASELPGLTLLEMLNDVNAAIVVDAIQSFEKPGTIHCLNEDELMSFTFSSKSAHGWGVAETLKLGRQLLLKIPPMRIIGVEAAQMQMGTELSEAVQQAVPKVCDLIEKTVNDLLNLKKSPEQALATFLPFQNSVDEFCFLFWYNAEDYSKGATHGN